MDAELKLSWSDKLISRTSRALIHYAAALVALVLFFRPTSAATDTKLPCGLTREDINRFFRIAGYGKEYFNYDSSYAFFASKRHSILYTRRILNGKVAILDSNGGVRMQPVPYENNRARSGTVYLGTEGEWELFIETDGAAILRRFGMIEPKGERLIFDAYERYLVAQSSDSHGKTVRFIDLTSGITAGSKSLPPTVPANADVIHAESLSGRVFLWLADNRSPPYVGVVAYDTETWKEAYFQQSGSLDRYGRDWIFAPLDLDVQNEKVLFWLIPKTWFHREMILNLSVRTGEIEEIKVKNGGMGDHYVLQMSPSACKRGGGQLLP
jgi:hypothetical protein